MKIKCSKEILINNINIVSKSVPSRTTMPILECILIIADEYGFRLISNDLELGIETTNIENSEIIKKGLAAIEARMFFDIIKSLPEDEIYIEVDEKNVALIKSGKTEFKILSQDGNQFPKLNIIEKNKKFTIKSAVLKNMIKKTKFSVSTDESKPILTGELLEIKENYVNMVAIDGFRISFIKEELEDEYEKTKVVIPARTLSELSKILSEKEDSMVNIYFNQNNILFELENCIILSRLLEGDYLKYEQIFVEDYNTKIEVSRQELLSSLERASLTSKENKKFPVKIEIKKDYKLIITSKTELCKSYEEVNVDIEGNELDIAFNPRYLIEALKVIDDEKIEIQFMTSLSPCIIKGIDNESYKYLILPLKLNEN